MTPRAVAPGSEALTAGQIELAARRRMRRALIGMVGLLTAAVVAVAWLALRDPAGRDAIARPVSGSGAVAPTVGGVPPAGGAQSTPAGAAAVWVAPAQWIALPAGSGVIDEYPVGFPADVTGAVTVAVRAVQYGWTLDPAVAARVAALYTSPQHATAAGARAAAGAEAWRARLGLAPAQPLEPDVGVAARPVGVQWRPRERGLVRVSVLAELTTHLPGREPLRQVAAITADVVWVAEALAGRGDWRVEPSAGPLPTPDPAPISTAEFNTLGWVAIQEIR